MSGGFRRLTNLGAAKRTMQAEYLHAGGVAQTGSLCGRKRGMNGTAGACLSSKAQSKARIDTQGLQDTMP